MLLISTLGCCSQDEKANAAKIAFLLADYRETTQKNQKVGMNES
jgi:hypothetical protein